MISETLIIEVSKAIAGFSLATIAIVKILKDHNEKKKLRNQKEKAENTIEHVKDEINHLSESLQFDKYITLRDWGPISVELVNLLEETCIDRFIILIAFNGIANPRYTSAVYQFRLGPQKPYQYAYFELDADYIKRIHHSMAHDFLHFRVADIPDSAIRSVYQLEGVTESVWFFIDKKDRGGNRAEMIYCSYSTHDDKEIDAGTITRCKLITNQIREAIKRNRPR